MIMFMMADIVSYEGALLAATGALTSAVIVLFSRIERQNKRWEKELDMCRSDLKVCQDDRTNLTIRITKLEGITCTKKGCDLRK